MRHLTIERARELVAEFSVPGARWPAHSEKVAEVAALIARTIRARGVEVDVGFVESSALVHDLGRSVTQHPSLHGVEGFKILINKGYSTEARTCLLHVLKGRTLQESIAEGQLPPEAAVDIPDDNLSKLSIEDKIVAIADAMVSDVTIISLESRYALSRQKYADMPWMTGNEDRARAIAGELEFLLGESLLTVAGRQPQSEAKLRILLVSTWEDPPRSYLKPQQGIMFLKKYLESFDLPVYVELIDPQISSPETAICRIKTDWDIIGFYATYPTLLNSVKLMLAAWSNGQNHANRPLLVGGGPGMAFDDVMRITPLDIAVIGEGEQFFVELVSLWLRERSRLPIPMSFLKNLVDLPGRFRVRYRSERGVHYYAHTTQRDGLLASEEINKLLPLEPWEIATHEPYVAWTRNALQRTYGFPIYATRGCARPGCLFCSSARLIDSRNGCRAPSPRVLTELFSQVVSSRLNCREFMMEDDDFIWNRDWMLELVAYVTQYKANGKLPPDLRFIIKARVEALDEELVLAMSQAGFNQVNVGVESGSINVLRELNKTADPANYLIRARRLRDWTAEGRLRTHAYMLFFSPKTHISDLLESILLSLEFLEVGGEISTYQTVLAFPASPYESQWKSGRVEVQCQSLRNPLAAVTETTLTGNELFHPDLGEFPAKVTMPVSLLPSDAETRCLWEQSEAQYPQIWEDCRRLYGWKTSTSARAGLVRLCSYLHVLGNHPDWADYSQVELIRQRLARVMLNDRQKVNASENHVCGIASVIS